MEGKSGIELLNGSYFVSFLVSKMCSLYRIFLFLLLNYCIFD